MTLVGLPAYSGQWLLPRSFERKRFSSDTSIITNQGSKKITYKCCGLAFFMYFMKILSLASIGCLHQVDISAALLHHIQLALYAPLL